MNGVTFYMDGDDIRIVKRGTILFIGTRAAARTWLLKLKENR